MANTNIQGPIPLTGRGFVSDENSTYQPGEYPVFDNVFLDENGHIIERNDFKVVAPTNRTVLKSQFQLPSLFVSSPSISTKAGALYPVALFAGNKLSTSFSTDFYTGGGYFSSAPPITAAATPATGYNVIKNIVYYNGHVYYIVMRGDATNDWITIFKHGPNGAAVGSPVNVASTVLGSRQYKMYIDSFVFKDRLWIVTSNGLYASKVADFADWAAPEGAFFLYDNIQAVSYLGDSIYILCESEIYVLSYSADPNIDSSSRLIASGISGRSSTVYENTVVFIDARDALYAIEGMSVNKIIDLKIRPNNKIDEIGHKIVAYDKYLAILLFGEGLPETEDGFKMPGSNISYMPRKDFGIRYAFNSKRYEPYVHTRQSSFYMFNMDNLSLSHISINDQRNGFDDMEATVLDITTHPTLLGNRLFVLTGKRISKYNAGAGTFTYSGHGYIYEYSVDNTSHTGSSEGNNAHHAYDTVIKNTVPGDASTVISLTTGYKNVGIFIKDFAPDGSEFLMKKFRSVLVQGTLDNDHDVFVLPGDTTFPDGGGVWWKPGIPATGFQFTRSPNVYRIPVNQRARALSLYIRRSTNDSAYSLSDMVPLEIQNINTLWTYTGRLPVNRLGKDT